MTINMKPFPVLLLLGSLTSFLSAKKVDFAREVLPVLSNKCFVCHGPDTKKKDLVRLDSFEGATRDLGGYRAIDVASLKDSEILARLHDADDPMPPEKAEKKLTDQERDLLSRWVKEGGKYAKHWAFVKPQKPEAKGNAIDYFVGAKLQAEGKDFAPDAERAVLARRASLVLTGLPPEPKRLQAFLDDGKQDAYERFVDELLASSRFGEHQARYWLDAVRYGDTHGLHLDNKRGIYPYRDWVVRALNENLPLDQFITWQLAGDLLPKSTLEQKVATGFVRMNPSTAEGGAIPAEFQAKNNFDRVENLGISMLGLSLICARCHTHKYDPVLQTEYFQLLAFFNSTAEGPMDGNRYEYAPNVRAPSDQKAWKEWEELKAEQAVILEKLEQRNKTASPPDPAYPVSNLSYKFYHGVWDKMPDFSKLKPKKEGKLSTGRFDLSARDRDDGFGFVFKGDFHCPVDGEYVFATISDDGSQLFIDGKKVVDNDGLHPEVTREGKVTLKAGKHRLEVRFFENTGGEVLKVSWKAPLGSAEVAGKANPMSELQKKAADLASRIAAAEKKFTTTLVAKELPKPRVTKLLHRGEYDQPQGEPLQPGVPAALGILPKDAPANRLGLAQWLVSPEQPLVARVLVNRIWQRTFGEGLVRTPADFGLQGEQPTHPQLLDWLAVELRESGWNLKGMLRSMVTSRSFRQSSARRADLPDPENRLLGRGPSHRLDAEVLRDIALWSSGLLDPFMGGEGVKPYQPSGMWKALMHPGSNTKNYVADKGERLYRRSLYVYWKRTSPHPMMTLFDAPSRESSCVQRSRTSTPTQSLALLNETQRVETARKLAERLVRQAKDDDARLNHLFTLLASRAPSEVERAACAKLLAVMRERYMDAEGDALALLSVGDIPRDPKLKAAEVAAWTQLAVIVLASDAALFIY
tara:strand:- start:4675 stop:7440 length:2766 start_codon:yes stop_codon:yes gene_type:complete